MCVAAYEMKRLGLAHKPLIIGLKANVHEIADTFRKAYPAAKVLYPGKEDFTPCPLYTSAEWQSDTIEYRRYIHSDDFQKLMW